MDKEQFIKWRENGGKIYKYVYEVEAGKEDLRKSECEVDAVYEDGFKTFGFGYHIPFDCLKNHLCSFNVLTTKKTHKGVPTDGFC